VIYQPITVQTMRPLLMFWCLLLAARVVAAPAVTFSSPVERVPVLELYTSHGCSSCPPADAWLRRFVSHTGLWNQIVPLAFHVDYWDGLGWPDQFASAAFSKRQRDYRKAGRIRSVYTPGFVLDGQEWRGWFRGDRPGLDAGRAVGRLELQVDPGGEATLRFAPTGSRKERFTAHLAVLGFGLSSSIGAGENAGHTLEEDFVVLGVSSGEARAANADLVWTLDWPKARQAQTTRRALAAWVSVEGDPAPVQAVGGWLP